MRIFGLTGPTGAGKGAVSSLLASRGIPTVNADAVYHALLAQGGPMTDELAASFGTDVLDGNGRIDRKRLGGTVFGKDNTPELLKLLNSITHKYVVAAIKKQLNTWKKDGVTAAVIDAPQLFEAGLEQECEAVFCVLADRDVRLARIMARDGITKEAALHRIEAQHTDDFFLSRCHFILENNGDLQALSVRVNAIFEALQL